MSLASNGYGGARHWADFQGPVSGEGQLGDRVEGRAYE